MVKTTYSDEEIRQVLQSLYLEKKRSKELSEQLQLLRASAKAEASKEMKKLKALLAAFKKRAVEQSEGEDENRALQGQLDSLKRQLEEKAELLRSEGGRFHDLLCEEIAKRNALDLEVRAAREKAGTHESSLDDLSSKCRRLEEELSSHTERLHDLPPLEQNLKDAMEAREELEKKLAQAIADKEEAASEFEILTRQLDSLKNIYQEQSRQLQNEKAATEELRGEIAKLSAVKDSASVELESTQQRADLLESECLQLKQEVIRGVRTANELSARLDTAVKERSEAFLRANHIHKELERCRAEAKEWRDKAGQEQVRTAEHEAEVKSLSEQCFQIDILKNQLNALVQERESSAVDFALVRKQMEEQEEELIKAQQHLAKKVREAAVMEMHREDDLKRIREFQEREQAADEAVAEYEAAAELARQQEKRLQEQLAEQERSHKKSAEHFEEKIQELNTKLDALQARIKELEPLEEKQKHLQNILSNLGPFLVPQEPLKKSPREAAEANDPCAEEAEPKKKREGESLFDMPKSPQRHRKTFLE